MSRGSLVDDDIAGRCSAHANRLAFLVESLADLDDSLRQLGGALVIRRGRWPAAMLALAKTTGATAIHLADDYSGYAKRRLASLCEDAAASRIQVIRHPGVTIAEPGSPAPAGGCRVSGVRPLLPPLARPAAGPARGSPRRGSGCRSGGRRRVPIPQAR